MYAARFIELVRNKTPKITLFTNMAKCQLMESLTEFEAYFYAGEKITKLSDNSIKAYNEHGLMVSDNSEQLFSLWPTIWQHFNQCLEKCQMIEKKMNEMENIGDDDWFPIVVGRKPIPLAERGLTTTEINRNVMPMTPRTPRVIYSLFTEIQIHLRIFLFRFHHFQYQQRVIHHRRGHQIPLKLDKK